MKKRRERWVFWLRISKRPQWFKYWWKTRGANFIEFQVWKYRISIGMPWEEDYVRQFGRASIDCTNKENLKQPLAILL